MAYYSKTDGVLGVDFHIDSQSVVPADSPTAATDITGTSYKLNVGAFGEWAGWKYQGYINQILIFDRVLTDKERHLVGNHYNTQYSLHTELVTTDLTNNFGQGKLNNGVVFDSSDKVWDFDGVNDHIDIFSSIPSVDNLSTGTMECWAKPATGGATQYMASFWGPSTIYHQFEFVGGKFRAGMQGSSTGGNKWVIESDDVVVDGEFHHFVLIQDGIEPKIYMDGILLNSNFNLVGTDKTVWFDFNPFTLASIGSYQNASNFFDGGISSLKIYNKALTASEIKYNYDISKSRFGL